MQTFLPYPSFVESAKVLDRRIGWAPDWLGNPEFHASHRANLLRKNPEHYSRFGWTEDPTLPYIWPKE